MLGPNPSFLKEKLDIVSSLLRVCCHARGGVYGEILSQVLLPPPPICPVCRIHSGGFRISFRTNCSIFRLDSVRLWEEVNLGASYVAILNQNSLLLHFNILPEATNDNLAHEKSQGIQKKC